MWEVRPKFRDLTEESKIQEHLLSQVLPIYLDYMKHNSYKWNWPWEDTRIPPHRTFRTFSRSMRNAIDRYHEEQFVKNFKSNRRLYDSFCIDSPGILSRILANFSGAGNEETRAKRVFHRSLEFDLRRNYNRYESDGKLQSWEVGFQNQMSSLLTQIGNQLWHFSFSVSLAELEEIGISKTQAYLLLREWVSLMPNLKWLYVNFNFECTYNPKTIPKETIDHHPFPHLSLLEKLSFGPFYDSPESLSCRIAASIIRPNLQIKILDVGFVFDSSSFTSREMTSLYPMLELEAFHCDPLRMDMHLPKPIFNLNWKLKSLDLRMSWYMSRSIGQCFNFFNNFPTIEILSLDMGEATVEDKELPFLKLPNLAKFWFRFKLKDFRRQSSVSDSSFLRLFSLQFIIHSRGLKSLTWIPEFERDTKAWQKKLRRFLINREQHEKMINFRGGYRDLTFSNIWDIFPELQDVVTRNYRKFPVMLWCEYRRGCGRIRV